MAVTPCVGFAAGLAVPGGASARPAVGAPTRQDLTGRGARTPSPAPRRPRPPTSSSAPAANIRCAYVDQLGVGCYARTNGRWAVIKSFGGSGTVRSPGGLPAGRVLPYGSTWRQSTFCCLSSTAGMTCQSSYTGRGFLISRGGASTW